MFAAPSAPTGGIEFDKHLGALLLVDVLGQEHGVKTAFGDKDPVRANVSVIDGEGAGETYEDTLLFPTILISQTKNQVGQKVLGRLGQGNAKPGQKPPWMLHEAGPEDIKKAEAWVAKQVSSTVTPAAAPF